jgi:hypothetical protein
LAFGTITNEFSTASLSSNFSKVMLTIQVFQYPMINIICSNLQSALYSSDFANQIVPTSSPDEDELTKLPLTVSPEPTVIETSPLAPDNGHPIDCYVRLLFEMVAPPQQENGCGGVANP